MPLAFEAFDVVPLVHGFKIEVKDEDLLAEYVAKLVLGFHRHVSRIINSRLSNDPAPNEDIIDSAIEKIKKPKDSDKRDGWIFQMISWIALQKRYSGKNIFLQIPHDAPAQHGIDGLAILLSDSDNLEYILITEDKATKNPRTVINQQVWVEFKNFEDHIEDNKLVSRISGMLDGKIDDSIVDIIEKDIFDLSKRKYRLGITPLETHQKEGGYKRLFKVYDECVSGDTNSRRTGDTLYKPSIRKWMDSFSQKVVSALEDLSN